MTETCDRCGRVAALPELYPLPDGLEQALEAVEADVSARTGYFVHFGRTPRQLLCPACLEQLP